MTYRDIAERQLISPQTVRKHVGNIYEKLPAKSKIEAPRPAKKNGWL